MNKTSIVICAVLALLIGWFAVWFKTNFERVEEEIDRGFSQEARRNEYLAATRLLEQSDAEVIAVERFADIEDFSGVGEIFLSSDTTVFSEQQFESLLDWINGGGHFIYAANEIHNGNRILEKLGAEVYDNEYSDDDEDFLSEDDPDYDAAESEEEDRSDYTTLLSFNGLDYELKVEFDSNTAIHWTEADSGDYHIEPFYAVGDTHGLHFLQYEWGDGLITLLSDDSIFTNDYIADADHAFLLLRIMGKDTKVALITGNDVQALWKIMGFYMPEFLWICAILFIAWLASTLQHFGPKRAKTVIQRRSFVEHLLASATFYWRQNQQQRLLLSLRSQAIKPIQRRVHGFDQLSQQEQVNLLVDCTPFNQEQLHYAFFDNEPMQERTYIEVVRILKAIRENL